MHFAHLMCCIERPARFLSPAEAVHGGTGFIQPGDAVLRASRGGKTRELLPILDIAKRKGAAVIAVTENADSPLALGADILLKMSVTRETDRYDSQGTTSFTVLNVLFHALQAALIERTGYKNEQFAVIHPGGAVGERLNAERHIIPAAGRSVKGHLRRVLPLKSTGPGDFLLDVRQQNRSM